MSMLPNRTIPRPTFAQVFATNAEKDVRSWTALYPDFGWSHFDSSMPDVLVSLATECKRDAFAYCEALKTRLEWPADEILVGIFTSAIKYVERKALRVAEMEWVMKTGMRWNAPVGTVMPIMDAQVRYHREAKVVSVDSVTATAKVEWVRDPKGTIMAYAEKMAVA